MKRSEARELLMQMLFEMDVHSDFSNEKRNSFIENHGLDDDQKTYFMAVHSACVKNLAAIDKKINDFSRNWSIKTMNRVDVSILRVAITEIFYSGNVPASIAINEAVELGKKFGGENSGRFINGILGSITKENE